MFLHHQVPDIYDTHQNYYRRIVIKTDVSHNQKRGYQSAIKKHGKDNKKLKNLFPGNLGLDNAYAAPSVTKILITVLSSVYRIEFP